MATRYLGPALFLGVALAGPATLAQSTTPTFIEGAAFSTGTKVPTATVTLTGAVAQGNLLVGWFAQYGDPAQVRVSDNVNGTWTRAPRSLTFLDDTGDIALYYRENTQAAPGGVTITVSVSSSAYLLGSVADYSGVALAGSLDEIASARDLGTAVDSGATAPVGAGELVFAALVSGGSAGSVTPGSSLGVPYTPRAQTSNVSAYEEDITSSAAGGQHGTATLASSADWYAVCAVFHPRPAAASSPPSAPTGLEATSVASTRVALSWSPSSGGVGPIGRHRALLPGELRPRAVRRRDHGVGVGVRLSAGGGRALSRCGRGGSARPGHGSARPGKLRQRGSDRLGPRRRAGRGGRPHRRPAGLGASRKQPEGAVRPRRAERELGLRPRGHPVQRRRPAGGEPDPRHGHQLEHGARHLPSRFHHHHDHHAARDDHHDYHPAAVHLQHHVHQHHAAAHLHHAASDDDPHRHPAAPDPHHAASDDDHHHRDHHHPADDEHHQDHDHADAAATDDHGDIDAAAADDHADTATAAPLTSMRVELPAHAATMART